MGGSVHRGIIPDDDTRPHAPVERVAKDGVIAGQLRDARAGRDGNVGRHPQHS